MDDASEPARISVSTLAAAFPAKYGAAALMAAEKIIERLDPRYRWGTFPARIEGETVLVPVRLHFAFNDPNLTQTDPSWPYSAALETRSTNGYQRQRALNHVLQSPQPWIAPFVVSLIGGYIIEVLDDILLALNLELKQILVEFIVDNRLFWETTKRQVTSYWSAYYRYRLRNEGRPVFSREDYVGFRIVNMLEAAALTCTRAASK